MKQPYEFKATFKVTALILLLSSTNLSASNYYWVGGSGDWSDYSNHWVTSPGGSSYHTQSPTSTDNVFFESNSFSAPSQKVTINTIASCNDMDWTGATNSPDLKGSSGGQLNIYGSLTLISAMSTSYYYELIFRSSSTGNTVTTAGNSFNTSIDFHGTGGEWTLQDNLSFNSYHGLYLLRGTLNTNGYTVTTNEVNLKTAGAGLSLGVRTLNMGASVFNIIGTSARRWLANTNTSDLTINAGTSTVNFKTFGNYNTLFEPAGKTFYNVNLQNTYGETNIYNNGTYNNLTVDPGVTVKLSSSTTQTINGGLVLDGVSGNMITIKGTATFSKSSGEVCAHYTHFSNNSAIGGATFNADGNSIDNGGNSGWNFGVDCIFVLPIELLDFNASYTEQNKVKLNWITATELNNDYFTIERSVNGINWEEIEKVDGKGNSSVTVHYSWIDYNPICGTTYYRLKQTDFNGASEYHGIRTVSCEPTTEISIYPNPFENGFTISLSENTSYPTTVEVIDYLGRKVYSQIIENATTEILLEDKVSAGTYFVKVFNETTQMVERIVKMN